jgi:hypothetical protein
LVVVFSLLSPEFIPMEMDKVALGQIFPPTLHFSLAGYCSTSSLDLAHLVQYATVELQCQGTQSRPASTVT